VDIVNDNQTKVIVEPQGFVVDLNNFDINRRCSLN
jgi:hypothetical protein